MCALFQPEVCYLGHVVSARGVATDPSKIEVVKAWPTPKSLKDVQTFLGLAGYYRQFIPDFATTASPRLTSPAKVLRGTGLQDTSSRSKL